MKFIKTVAVAALAAVALTGCTEKDFTEALDSLLSISITEGTSEPVVVTSDLPVVDQLQELVISEPQQNMHTYDRDSQFPHWMEPSTDWGWSGDTNTNCNVRWYVLWLQSNTLEWEDPSFCILGESTYWVDPYGQVMSDGSVYILESDDPSDFDIDHIVSLGDAWRTGAEGLTQDQRTSLANDPLNLVAVSTSVNRSKGDSTPADFMPTEEGGFLCEYATRYIQVKHKYNLTVMQADFNVLAETLNSCSIQ